MLDVARPPELIVTVWPGADVRRGVIVGDPDPPAVRRRLAGHRDVAAEADQDAAAEPVGDLLRAPVGGPRLGCRAEVDLHTVVKPGPAAAAVQVHAVASRAPGRPARSAAAAPRRPP